MRALHNPQTAMRDTLAFGPSACPPHLFGGNVAEVVRGLKVHANTISYARLTSLEASFPRARDWIGHASFNDLSRRFVEGGGGVAEPLALIGRDFAAWLAVQGQHQTLVALARYEWLWLQVYHAAEADAMRVAAFAGKDDIAIMSTHVARHPASAYVLNGARLDVALGLGDGIDAAAVMISRPDAEMTVTPLPPLQLALFEAVAAPTTIGAMLEAASDDAREDELFTALIALINAGAFIQTGDI